MAFVREVHIIDAGDQTIKVTHQFWGETLEEVNTYHREHLESCEYFRAAAKDGRVLDSTEEIDAEDLPDFEEDDT